MRQHAAIKIFAILTSIGAYLMLLMGSIVSKTESGEGCGGSWPFCHGQLIPENLPIETVFEYSHRIISSLDGMLILILTVWVWLAYRQFRYIKLLGFMSLFFVVLQGALGAFTVVFSQTLARNTLLALHFGFALISFASVILLTIRLFQIRIDTPEETQRFSPAARAFLKGAQYPAWGLLIYTYVVVYTGALVRHTHATMGCGHNFPGCGSTVFPSISSPAGVQMLHRYAAASIWLLALGFLIFVLLRFRKQRGLVGASWLAFILITGQAASGIFTVLSGGILMLALLHTTIISIFFSVICYICMYVGAPWSKRVADQEQAPADVDVSPVAAQHG